VTVHNRHNCTTEFDKMGCCYRCACCAANSSRVVTAQPTPTSQFIPCLFGRFPVPLRHRPTAPGAGARNSCRRPLHTPAERQRCNRPISPLPMRQLLDTGVIAQINTKKTGNYARKRLIDMANADINTLTPDRRSLQLVYLETASTFRLVTWQTLLQS
jgi:hypothetical protein